MSLREKVLAALRDRQYDALVALSAQERNIFRTLISLTYSKEEVLCWRAIEGIGIVSGVLAGQDVSRIRNLAQRLLWMLRDESGNNAGSAPEILGEIVRNRPDSFADIAPIIASFHDEDMLRKGVLFAMNRIAEKRPDLFAGTPVGFLSGFLADGDPTVRGLAALLAGRLGKRELLPVIERMKDDASPATLYRDGDLVTLPVGQIAGETVILLQSVIEA